ncbi:hypothetical protein CC78DRAFT_194866 [Lojkania enalia]|uniref:Uncharacterized protein n=1 Tax=Lojkania enalia TaxID=147567 RepID=A0A9P4TQN2_9PLEO|nr:hypothetical protein CC78DRAFT_194866 [Didymosphaeria enalia]
MATEHSPKPLYHSPNTLGGRHHARRSSSRKSFTSTAAPPSPTNGSPRPLCPRDGDTFTYKPLHLQTWYIPQDLWGRLPLHLQSTLATLQHAGAAVLTGYERLEQHEGSRDADVEPKIVDDELEAQMEESVLPEASFPAKYSLKLRTDSSASQTESAIWSPTFSSSQSSGSNSPELSASLTTSPISPICLTPADAEAPTKRPRDRSLSKERSFSTPLEPHNHYYATELSQLRTESIPRLRHAARKVESEWYETKRQSILSPDDNATFEKWWAEKKSAIGGLNEKCKQLSIAIGMGPAGMGWTAP